MKRFFEIMSSKKSYFLLCNCIILIVIAGCRFSNNTTHTNIETVQQSAPQINISANSIAKKEPQNTVEPKNIKNLVNIKDIDNTIIVDLKYASADNFTGKVVYPFKNCLLRKETAQKLKNVDEQLGKEGFRIKIYDGYRPMFAQDIFWNLVKDERYVANPSKGGSKHSTGGAVDLTITDANGHEMEMPSKFDDFTGKGSRTNNDISPTARKNLEILTAAMTSNGFISIDTEWWHYYDKDISKYESVDVDPNLFK